MVELKCRHCGKAASFVAREDASDRGWQFVSMELRDTEAQTLTAGGSAAFCPDTPPEQTHAFIESLGRAIVERRILE